MIDTPAMDDKERKRRNDAAKPYVDEIMRAKKCDKARQWVTRCEAIIDRYREELNVQTAGIAVRGQAGLKTFPLLWANQETIGPAVYAKPPKAVVTRRFKDKAPLAKAAAEVLERACNFTIDDGDMNGAMSLVRDDRLLVARGQMWVRYNPVIESQRVPALPMPANDDDGEIEAYADEAGEPLEGEVLTDEDGPHQMVEAVTDETVEIEHVHWSDFGTNIARTWREVWLVWRRVYMTKAEGAERFGDWTKALPVNHSDGTERTPDNDDTDNDDECGEDRQACIYECWDKRRRKAYWLQLCGDTCLLEEKDDPLHLRGFFPCPEPTTGTTGPNTTIPVPDFIYYQSQAQAIDTLTARIDKLADSLRLRGMYAGAYNETISTVMSSDVDAILQPVADFQAMASGGGLKGLIEWVPIDMVITTLRSAIEARTQLIQDVYQITGIGDILRGSTDPNETAAAQQLKAQWGSTRIRKTQQDLQRIARDTIRIAAEVIAEHFDAETLKRITGLPYLLNDAEKQALQQQIQKTAMQAQQTGQEAPPVPDDVQQQIEDPTFEEIVAFLRDDGLRSYSIDVETDSTIEADEQADKQSRTELLKVIGEFFTQALPVIQGAPQTAELFGSLLTWLVRGFRVGKDIEDQIEATAAQIAGATQQAQQAPQEPPPDPIEMQRVQIEGVKVQGDQQYNQAQIEIEMKKLELAAAELRLQELKLQLDHQANQQRVAAESQRTMSEVAA